MFNFFKKPRQHNNGVLDKQMLPASDKIALLTANALGLTLMLCKHSPNYEHKIGTCFARGYIVGYFDAARQIAGLQFNDSEEFVAYLIKGHMDLFGNEMDNAMGYCLLSVLHFQQDSQYIRGRETGGREYFEFRKGALQTAFSLGEFLRK